MKLIDLTEFKKKANKIEEIYREAKTLMNLQHKYIIKLQFAFVLDNDICLIMDYCEGGELIDLLQE